MQAGKELEEERKAQRTLNKFQREDVNKHKYLGGRQRWAEKDGNSGRGKGNSRTQGRGQGLRQRRGGQREGGRDNERLDRSNRSAGVHTHKQEGDSLESLLASASLHSPLMVSPLSSFSASSTSISRWKETLTSRMHKVSSLFRCLHSVY